VGIMRLGEVEGGVDIIWFGEVEGGLGGRGDVVGWQSNSSGFTYLRLPKLTKTTFRLWLLSMMRWWLFSRRMLRAERRLGTPCSRRQRWRRAPVSQEFVRKWASTFEGRHMSTQRSRGRHAFSTKSRSRDQQDSLVVTSHGSIADESQRRSYLNGKESGVKKRR